MFFRSYTEKKKNIENALLYGRLWRYDCSKEPEQRKSSKWIINTPTKDMLLHKAVKNNQPLHIINSKGKCFCICGHDYRNEVWQLVRILCAVSVCLIYKRWLLPAENVTCYEMLHTLVQNVAYFGLALFVVSIFTSNDTENSFLKYSHSLFWLD